MKNAKKYEEFESRIMVLNNMFEKLDGIFDIENYKTDVENIKKQIDEAEDGKKVFNDLEYTDYISKLDGLISTINEEYLPIYEIYLLTSHIGSRIEDMNEDNYEKLSAMIINIIDHLRDISSSKREDCKAVLKKAYEVVYKGIIYEKAINKTKIITGFRYHANSIMHATLGSLIKNDVVSKLSKEEILDIELNHINEGIEYNYLSDETIEKIGKESSDDKYQAYQDRRKSAVMEVLSKIDDIHREENAIAIRKKDDRKDINKLRGKLAVAHLKAIALLMIPISTFTWMWSLGGEEYKHTTTKKNVTKNEIIGAEEVDYKLAKYAYKAEIKKCSPWRPVDNGKGYIRDVEEYEYINEESSETISPEKIMKMVEAKKTYAEKKNVLDEDENTVDPEIIITETVRDDNIHAHSTWGTIGMLVVGLIGLGLLDMLVVDITSEEVEYVGYLCDYLQDIVNLGEEFRRTYKGRLTRKEIKETTEMIGDKIVKFREEYSNTKTKYGDISEDLTKDQYEDVKKLIRRG